MNKSVRQRYRTYESLKSNAADYIDRSVSAYSKGEYKIALLFLWSGLVLFMKCRLFLIHPSLIFDRMENVVAFDPVSHEPVFRDLDLTGNRRTVNFDNIKTRLKELSLNSIILEHASSLDRVRSLRNRVEHFVDDLSQREYLGAIDAVLPVLNALLEDELQERPSDLLKSWGTLIEIDAFYQERVKRAREKIAGREYLAATDGDELYQLPCENCPDGQMEDDEDGILVCHACGYRTAFRVCSHCAQPIPESEWSTFFEETGVCNDCLDRATED